MTISSETRKTSPFVGNNVTTAFPFTFKVFSSSEVEVVRVVDATEVETTLVLTTDYTVSLNADQDADPGGTVTLLSALATGTTLVITSNVANTQSTALTNNGGFYPNVIEDALDRATIQIQQLSEQVERSVKVPITSTTDPDALVASVVASEASAAASAAAAAASAAAAEAAVPSGTLGYTPVNITGDTMTGQLEVPSLVVNGSSPITSLGNAATKTTGAAAGNVPLWEYTLLNGSVELTTTDTVVAAHRGKLIDCTGSGGWTLGFDAAATLGVWAGAVRNSTTGTITLDPYGSEQIDDAATLALAAGESCFVLCNGTALKTVGRASSSVPTGQVAYFAMDTAPTGWLKANGAAISRATYAALFAAIGTTYGAGDGATTFNLPDLRGEFLRGFDDARGVDSGRVFGSAQAHQMESHTHSVQVIGNGTITGGGYPNGDDPAGPAYTTGSAGGGSETRPRNIAMLACIKY